MNFATPLDNPTDVSVVVPSLNVTLPVGAMELVDFTVALNVTDCPYVDGFRDEVTAEVVVAALFTVCVRIGDVLPKKSVAPPYTAVMDRAPADTVVVVSFATLLDNPTDPSVVVPSLNVTLPIGVPEVEVTVTINVTDCPYVDGFSDEVIAEVVVIALLTLCVNTGDVLPVKFASPPYIAVIEWEPIAKVEVAKAANPPSSMPVPSVLVPSLNVTVPVGVPEIAAITVAVKMTDWPRLDGSTDETTVVVDCCEELRSEVDVDSLEP